MESESPPDLVASRSCRNDRKLVAFIIEQRMILNCTPIITFWSNLKDNYHGMWFYNKYERYITRYLSECSNAKNLKTYQLEQLNMLIAYSIPDSKQLMEGYLKRAHLAYASEEDFYCLYNVFHAADIDAFQFVSDSSALSIFDGARVRGFGSMKPFPQKDCVLENCYSLMECKENKNFGRHLIARELFGRGNTVLSEKPFCTTIEFLALRLTIRVYKMFPGTSDELDAYIRTLSDDIKADEYSTPNTMEDYRKVYRLSTNRKLVSRQMLTKEGLRAVSLIKLLER
uniref:Uncharacterized protein n=1 Tax=Anopheles maculatus TaxID=74869 RepID=A0A182T442_9DIPT